MLLFRHRSANLIDTNMSLNEHTATPTPTSQTKVMTLLRLAGWLGVAIATPFFLWVPLGMSSYIPSMMDVFGFVGLRIPAAITIAGLLLAAVGFHRF